MPSGEEGLAPGVIAASGPCSSRPTRSLRPALRELLLDEVDQQTLGFNLRYARMGGEEGVNRVFLYELRHTRIPKYSTHKPQSARDSLQRRDRTHKFRTHAAALHAPRARNHHTQLS